MKMTVVHEIQIEGMSCAGCAEAVKRALDTKCKRVHVDVVKGRAIVEGGKLDELLATINGAGFKANAQEKFQVLDPFYPTVLLSTSVLLLHFTSHYHQIELVLSFLLFVYRWDILWRAVKDWRAGSMSLLIALNGAVSLLVSVVCIMLGTHASLLEGTASLYLFTTLGKRIESRLCRQETQEQEVQQPKPSFTKLATKGNEVVAEVWTDEIKSGDLIRLDVGEVHIDGVVVEGMAWVTEASITGEPGSVRKACGETIWAGSRIQAGQLIVLVQKIGEETLLGQTTKLVKSARLSTELQEKADIMAAWIIPALLGLGIVTFIYWRGRVGWIEALRKAITVTSVTCPCALGLAIPVPVMYVQTTATRMGFLLKGNRLLENALRIKNVVVDKTGTLTTGEMVAEIVYNVGGCEDFVYALACCSEHPVSKAITKCLGGYKTDKKIEHLEAVPGMGLVGVLNGVHVAVGSGDFLGQSGDDDLVYASVNESLCMSFRLTDTIRHDSKIAIDWFHQHKYNVTMCTGDRWRVAKQLAQVLGIENVKAECSPIDKASACQNDCLFIGDGINDAVAMQASGLSIAMPGSSDLSRSVADILLLRPSAGLSDAVAAFEESRALAHIIRQNLIFAVAYNALILPIAMGLFEPRVVSPHWACGAIMAASSLCIVLNSRRLLHFEGPRLFSIDLPVGAYEWNDLEMRPSSKRAYLSPSRRQ